MIDEIIKAIHAAQLDLNKIRAVAACGPQIEKFEDSEAELLLDRLAEMNVDLAEHESLHQILQPVVAALSIRANQKNAAISPKALGQITSLYQSTPPASNLRNHLLGWLAIGHHPECIQTWTELICHNPPEHRTGVSIAFGPVMNRNIEPEEWMMQSLLSEGVLHLQLAPAIYDLFNFYYREKLIEQHPASDRASELTELLGQLVGQLGRIEEGSFDEKLDPQLISQQVADSVALIVSLCDTLAIIEYEPCIGKLHQALSLKHRRVQLEAAAALARLEDEFGVEALIKLAEEPIVRLRVLSYAEELGLLNEISLELQGEIAQAESRLAMWLAEPLQMGIAPSKVELVDNREMYWPSYEHPMQCYLFRFQYGSSQSLYSNLAICGPLVHAFSADLKVLSIDDAYALFAGWQTVHDEIFQMSVERAQQAFPNEWRRLYEELAAADQFTAVEVRFVGSFFGKIALIANCEYENEKGTVIADGETMNFVGEGSAVAPIDFNLAFAIWRGRQLLSTFNPA